MALIVTYCRRCGGKAHELGCRPYRAGGVDWTALMAHRVREGEPMSLEQIGKIAGVSRERIRQIEFDALRKLANRPSVRKAVSDALNA